MVRDDSIAAVWCEVCCGSGHSLKYHAKLICSPMEAELNVPKEYFDYVYSVYGIFIFSWHHTLHYCVARLCDERKEVIEDDKLVFHRSYL